MACHLRLRFAAAAAAVRALIAVVARQLIDAHGGGGGGVVVTKGESTSTGGAARCEKVRPRVYVAAGKPEPLPAKSISRRAIELVVL